ncbi:ROK family protein [Oceanobacillus chungangensis]|nr:ROK family protein [Oceanobacillus chungangensis]
MEYSIGVDIGGTKIAMAIVDQNGKVFYKNTYPTPNTTNLETMKLLNENVLNLIDIANQESMHLVSVGIGSAGQVDYENGKILSGTVNIKDWNNVDIRGFLSQTTKLPIYVDNDANTFVIAEHQLGGGKNVNDIISITLGTGIGGGVVTGGKVLRGAWGGAAELGHLTVKFDGPKCNCGSIGCIETYASGSGIANRMRERLQNVTSEKFSYYKEHPEKLTSKEVFEWYEHDFSEAKEVINLAITALAYGVVNVIHTFNPSTIIFGGGLAESNRWFITEVQKKVKEIGLSSLVKDVEIKVSELGYDAGLIGAAYQVWADK